MTTPAWHPDPMQRHELRWWDGQQWTDQVSDHGAPGVDALFHTSEAAPTPQWSAPDVALPTSPPPAQFQPGPAPSAPAATSAAGRRRNGIVAAAILAAVALVGGAFVLTRDDSDSSSGTSVTTQAGTVVTTVAATAPPSTAPPTSVLETTLAPTTIPPSTAPPVTAPPPVTGAVLAAALPGAADAPADWVLYEEPNPSPEPFTGEGYGYCSMGNDIARAQSMASIGQAYGANWDLPTGAWFGVDAFAFATEADAQAFLDETDLRANGCMTDPPMFSRPETEADWFTDPYADDAIWNVADVSGGFVEPTTDAAFLLRTTRDRIYSLSYDGIDFAATSTSLNRYERHGRVVVSFWLYGSWDYLGFGNPEEMGAYQPIDSDLDALAATFRPTTLQRLTAAGAL